MYQCMTTSIKSDVKQARRIPDLTAYSTKQVRLFLAITRSQLFYDKMRIRIKAL